MVTVAQCAAGARDHEEELRLFEALECMPVRHRSVSALALVRALTMAPVMKHLAKGLRFVLVVSTHLGKSGHVKVLLCYSKGIDRSFHTLCLDTVGVHEICADKSNAIQTGHRAVNSDIVCREWAAQRWCNSDLQT